MFRRVLPFVICILLTVTCLTGCGSKKNEQITVTSAQLIKVLEDSNLSFATYQYDGVAEKKNDDGKSLYYVSYNGEVRAGIEDFQQLTVEKDESGKTIITIPEVKVTDARVVDGSLEFIYADKKYKDTANYAEAQQLAQQDLEASVQEDQERLLEAARENAVSTIRAMTEPLIGSDSFEIVLSGVTDDD